MEVVLEYSKVNGVLYRYIPIRIKKLFREEALIDWESDSYCPPDYEAYNWVIPNIYKRRGFANYYGKGKDDPKIDGSTGSKARSINHYNDPLYHAIQEVGPDKCVCNCIKGLTEEQAFAIEALMQYLDKRHGMKYGQKEWKGEWLINKREEDADMNLINKYFDLDGNNYIKTVWRKMHQYKR